MNCRYFQIQKKKEIWKINSTNQSSTSRSPNKNIDLTKRSSGKSEELSTKPYLDELHVTFVKAEY